MRIFNPDTQLSGEKTDAVSILPGREIPFDASDVKLFRHRYRERFAGQPSKSRVYREVSDGISHGGIEYYMPLFFEQTATLIDYLPAGSVIFAETDLHAVLDKTWAEIEERYALCSLDPERPILEPHESFATPDDIQAQMTGVRRVAYSSRSIAESTNALNAATVSGNLL